MIEIKCCLLHEIGLAEWEMRATHILSLFAIIICPFKPPLGEDYNSPIIP